MGSTRNENEMGQAGPETKNGIAETENEMAKRKTKWRKRNATDKKRKRNGSGGGGIGKRIRGSQKRNAGNGK